MLMVLETKLKKGIGWDGKTLKEMLKERDELTKKTGHYYGITKLTLKEEDPIKYERFYSALLEAVMAARETSKYVAASPGARELGELLFGFLTPEGDSVAVSAGLIGHQGAFPISIRFMIENDYEVNPGIKDGDIFFACDPPTTGTPHAGDVYTFIPIFYNDELIGWAAACNHCMETGPPIAATWTPWSSTTYSDGYCVPPTKVGENLSDFKWHYIQLHRRTRAGIFNVLDHKMRVAGNKMIRERVLKIIEEYGVEYFKRAIREIVEETRQRVSENIRKLSFPGRTRFAAFHTIKYKGIVDKLWPYSAKNWILHLFAEDHIDTANGKVHIDFDGISPADLHALCGYKGIIECNLWLNVVDNFGFYVKPNTGFNLAITYNMPKGALYNPPTDQYSAGDPWAGSIHLMNAFDMGTQLSLLARGFVEESWNSDLYWTGYQGEIILPNGIRYGWCHMDLLGASASPARPYMDGETLSNTWWNPAADCGSAEEWEYVTPGMYYLFRNILPNYFGHGKYRGGCGMQIAYYVTKEIKEAIVSRVGASTGEYTHSASVPGGGYPGPAAFLLVIHGTNILELAKKGEYPSSLLELKEWMKQGKLKYTSIEVHKTEVGAVYLKPGDIYVWGGNASGGWGDPLERKPELVEKDVNEGFLTPDVAERVYGVVLRVEKDGRYVVDEEATKKKREEIITLRKQKAVPFKEVWKYERELIKKGDLLEDVRNMYSDLFNFSSKFKSEFEGFWQIKVDELSWVKREEE